MLFALLSLALNRRARGKRGPLPVVLCVFAVVLGAGLWIGYSRLNGPRRDPQAILVLGGEPRREVFAARFARSHPHLPVWVSGGSNREYAEWVFAEAGIAPERVRLDYRAVDTVTNFTSLIDELEDRDIDSLYLITSDYHMRRARIIGGIVFGSRGIVFAPIAVETGEPDEPLAKSLRDGLRGVLWIATGRTGSNLRYWFGDRLLEGTSKARAADMALPERTPPSEP